MKRENKIEVEETLDPDDWEAMRKLGYKMLEDVIDYMETVRERPV